MTEKTGANDPVQFLNARLDEAEKRAQAAPPGPWAVEASGSITDAHGKTVIPSIGGAVEGRVSRWPEPPAAAFITANDPARTLREIEATRQLIARGGPFCTSECDDPDSEPKDPATNWTTPLEHHTDCDAYTAAGKVMEAVLAEVIDACHAMPDLYQHVNAGPDTYQRTVEYFVQCQQPDEETWAQCSSTMTDPARVVEELAAQEKARPDFQFRIARRSTTAITETVVPVKEP